MADDEGQKKEEATEEGGEESKGSFMSSPAVKIGLFVLLLGINAVVSFVVVQKVIRPKVAADVPEVEMEEPDVPAPGELFEIDGMIINPAGTRATRYLRVAVAVEFDPSEHPALGGELDVREHQFKDLLITEFASRTVDELTDSRVKEEIREELLARLNRTIADGQLRNLYFTEYVIQ